MKAASFEWCYLPAQYCCPLPVVGDPACLTGLPHQVQAAVSQSSEPGGAEIGGLVLQIDFRPDSVVEY